MKQKTTKQNQTKTTKKGKPTNQNQSMIQNFLQEFINLKLNSII